MVGSFHIVVKDKITGGEADVQTGDSIVKKGGRKFVDVARVLPDGLEGGRRIEKIETSGTQIRVCVRKHSGQGGHDSKSFVLNRYLELDGFFFESLGLWQGDGGKHKGMYFGNTCKELLLHFLKFSEERLGIMRSEFNVTVNSQNADDSEACISGRWSKALSIPAGNFTHVCRVTGVNYEYAQMYVNGIVLSELMNALDRSLRDVVLSDPEFAASYMRGVFAAEGQVALKEWGTIAYVAITCGTMEDVDWYKACLRSLGIETGKYQDSTNKFPIYGRSNLEAFGSLAMHAMHPKKKADFERGLGNYQRRIEDGDAMERKILEQLKSGPKTYDDLSASLNKGRSTIQSHYIPILEKKGTIRRAGKRKRAWLFELA